MNDHVSELLCVCTYVYRISLFCGTGYSGCPAHLACSYKVLPLMEECSVKDSNYTLDSQNSANYLLPKCLTLTPNQKFMQIPSYLHRESERRERKRETEALLQMITFYANFALV